MFETLIMQPIFNILIGIYSVIPGGDFGVAIIIFTILVRLCLYPLVHKQLHQTKLMRRLQPELKKIKAESKGDKQVEAMRMMELYKRRGVKPFQSILILLIQLPIFIALFQVIQVFTQHRDRVGELTYSFLEPLEPIKRLIENPDSFNQHMLGFIDLTGHAISDKGLNIPLIVLAIIAGVTQHIMTKQISPTRGSKKSLKKILGEAADGKQADQSDINEAVAGGMMKVMPYFMVFIMLSLPGALALYYVMSNIVAVIQQHFILRGDEEEMEEIAEITPASSKKSSSSTKARARGAKEAHITRIKANDSRRKKKG